MTIYNSSNCLGAVVFDLDTGKTINAVKQIDTATGEVVYFTDPPVVYGDSVVTYGIKFAHIESHFGSKPYPSLFTCWERIGQSLSAARRTTAAH